MSLVCLSTHICQLQSSNLLIYLNFYRNIKNKSFFNKFNSNLCVVLYKCENSFQFNFKLTVYITLKCPIQLNQNMKISKYIHVVTLYSTFFTEIFRSLLYEACGRIVNPTCGSVGLLWSGNWQLCQRAVESILNGSPITQIASDSPDTNNGPPLKAYDIRHISKDENSSGSNNLHRVKTRNRFKRTAKDNATRVSGGSSNQSGLDSSLSHKSETLAPLNSNSDSITIRLLQQKWARIQSDHRKFQKSDSLASVETPEASALFGAEPDSAHVDGEIELELRLGFEPASRVRSANLEKDERCKIGCSFDDGDCKMELGL